MGSRLGCGFEGHQVANLGPQRHQELGFEPAVEIFQLWRPVRLVRRVNGRQADRAVRDRHDTAPSGLAPGGRTFQNCELLSQCGISFSGVKNKPPYAIESVDHALLLAQLLQQEGPLRVTDAADRLGVSRSTAHRLLAMLVYRDFAEQAEDRRYRPGHILRPIEGCDVPIPLLRRTALPHLRALTNRVHESTNLVVRVATEVRFIATVECQQALRVGDRDGKVLPADLTSGGKALLAALSAAEVADLYASPPGVVDLARLKRQLALVRKRGFAINDQETEPGLTALGIAVHDPSGRVCAAVSIAMPSARFTREQIPGWINAISDTVTGIEQDLGTEWASERRRPGAPRH